MNRWVKHHGTRKWHDRPEGRFGVSVLMMGTSPNEVSALLKLGESFREIAVFEGSTIVGYKRLFKFWYIDSFLLDLPTFSPSPHCEEGS